MKEKPKAIDITTKGWSKEQIQQLKKTILAKGMKYQVQLKLADGTTKWLYAMNPDDVKPYCEQVGAKIVKVEDLK